MDDGSLHIVMLPWLAFGHILPFMELSKRMARHGHRVSLLVTKRNIQKLPRVPSHLSSLLRFVELTMPSIDHLPENAEASIDLPSDELRPYLRRAFDTFQYQLSSFLQQTLPRVPDWIVVDYAAYWAPPPQESDTDAEGESRWRSIFRWLVKQKPGSVVYVAFGSEVKLTSSQVHEIALGLERSQLPFVWALRAPADSHGSPATLPEGFEERTEGRGLVCLGWVPQSRLLAHPSTGGFLTHAGWSSVIEGLALGLPLVLMPLVFDQGLNARNLVERKISVEVPRNEEDGSFTGEGIATTLRLVMVEEQGQPLRAKAKEYREVFGDEKLNDLRVWEFL